MNLVLLMGLTLSVLVTGLFWLPQGHPTLPAPHSTTPLYLVPKFPSFHLSTSPTSSYTILLPDSPHRGPHQPFPSLSRWPLPWSSPGLPSQIWPFFFVQSQYCLQKANLIMLPRGLKILQWLLSANKIKSKILSAEYQTRWDLALAFFSGLSSTNYITFQPFSSHLSFPAHEVLS